MAEANVIHHGLEGVYFTQSRVCRVDGLGGRLYYRGYSIESLAKNSSFEEVCYLLLYGNLPKKADLKVFTATMRSERELPKSVLKITKEMAPVEDPMHVLETAVSALAAYDTEADDASSEANLRKSIRLIAKISSITAAIGRFRQGERYVRPSKALGHAENFLYMYTGRKPDKERARLMDTMLIMQAEHGSNASTFASLVTAATLSDIYSSVTSGVGTLKGSLHGGADEMALKMLYAIGKEENTEDYINKALEGKQRIMGFGHRMYKTYDPRARIIRADLMLLLKSSSPEVKNLTGIALRAEKLMIDRLGKSHGIWPNVDFFAGPVYVHIGIPVELFTPLFAVARMPGWCAHIIEYWQNNRLIRPDEEYVGPIDLEYVPLDKR